MANRRNVLIGLGGLVAAGGAALGTGAFTTVTAERTVNISTTGDANAFLGLTSARSGGDFVDTSGDTITIDLDGSNASSNANGTGLNQRAVTVFRNLVQITNNGTQSVNTITLGMNVSNIDDSTVSGSPTSTDVESAFSFTVSNSGNSYDVNSNPGDIVGSSQSIQNLASGDAVSFGMKIDLLPGDADDGTNSTSASGISELPDADYNLVITAETSNTNTTA